MPATNATLERSFSALRGVKTFLRSTMSQQRLNNLMLLHVHVHKDVTDTLELKDIANEFIGDSEHRLKIFLCFLLSLVFFVIMVAMHCYKFCTENSRMDHYRGCRFQNFSGGACPQTSLDTVCTSHTHTAWPDQSHCPCSGPALSTLLGLSKL